MHNPDLLDVIATDRRAALMGARRGRVRFASDTASAAHRSRVIVRDTAGCRLAIGDDGVTALDTVEPARR